jgi:ABC-type branched-subunit amino acid transport system substrate-binding protein
MNRTVALLVALGPLQGLAWAQSQLSPPAREPSELATVRQWLAQGRAAEAERLTRRALARTTSETAVASLRLALARSLFAQGRLDEARGQAEAVVTGLAGAERAAAYEILAEVALGRGEISRAAQALARSHREAPAERRQALRTLAFRLTSEREEDLRLAYEALLPTEFPAGHLAVRLAEIAQRSGRLEEARAYLAQSSPPIAEDPHLAALARTLRSLPRSSSETIDPKNAPPRVAAPPSPAASPSVAPPPPVGTSPSPPALAPPMLPAGPPPLSPPGAPPPGTRVQVALLAPLSGAAKDLGDRIVRGATIAAGPGGAAPVTLELVPRDSRGDPEEATRQIEALAREPRVVAVVGPILAREAQAAATRASELGLPLIALSAVEGLTALGAGIFRCFLTVARQARSLARHAVEKLGLRRFAILHPRTAYGEGMRQAFTDEAMRLGGSVVSVVSYPYGQQSFAAEAGALRRVAFDALFLPDGYRTVALAVGYLAAKGLPIGEGAGPREVRLLGTNEWLSEELLRRAGRYVQRAILAVGFSPASRSPEAQAFSQAFHAATGRPPSYVEAFAHDAIRLLREVVTRQGLLDRAALASTLATAEVAGATGLVRFNTERELTSGPNLVQVEGMSFKPIDSSPAAPGR